MFRDPTMTKTDLSWKQILLEISHLAIESAFVSNQDLSFCYFDSMEKLSKMTRLARVILDASHSFTPYRCGLFV